MDFWAKLQRLLLQLPFIGWALDLLTLCLSSFVLRTASGHYVANNLDKCERPIKPLKLYEFEFCPFCRKVRETLNVLDIDCIIYPCPRETLSAYGVATNESRFRNEAKKIGGKAMFPLLIDENSDITGEIYENNENNSDSENDSNNNNNNGNNNNNSIIMYESGDIIEYLWKRYGDKANAPPSYKIAQKTGLITLSLCNLVRNLPEYGLMRIPSRKPEQPLVLWEFEPSPFCKRVREALSCLEISYLKKTVARGSVNRKLFREKFGHLISSQRKALGLIQVPLLEDPNYNKIILESKDIVKYLYDTYKIGEMKDESWNDYPTDDSHDASNTQTRHHVGNGKKKP